MWCKGLKRTLSRLCIVLLYLGSSCAVDSREKLFSELKALAEKGNPEAQYHVGMMLNNGSGVGKDLPQAFRWFEKSASAGNPLAAYKVGCYYGGQFEGVVPLDPQKSLDNKLIAAKAEYSLAQYDVGIKYYKEGNAPEAVKWWERSAEQGFAMALSNLASIYKEGKVVPQDMGLAYVYFKLALLADGRKNEKAQSTLAKLKESLSPEQLQSAEKMVAEWKAKPSALTAKSENGIADAERLVKSIK